MQTSLDSLLRALLPNLPTMCLKNCIVEETAILLTFQPTMPTATCPACRQQSSRVRSRYWRTLADLPWAEQSVRLRLHLRKFACTNPTCTRRIFAERLPEVAAYARCTSRRHTAQVRLGLALGGEAGARLSRDLHLSTSAATLLRRVRGLAEPPAALPTVVGVDDWAFRKGVCYGTLLVDLQTHRPIDVLPDRTSATVLTWLKKHPQIAILCRDRSREYARAALEGAPQAQQVADRFHLVANLRDALQHLVERHRSRLAGIVLPSGLGSSEVSPCALQTRLPEKRSPLEEAQRQAAADKRLTRHQQIHALKAAGVSIEQVAQQLHLNRQTVQRYLRLEGACVAQRQRHTRSNIEAYLPYLLQRWGEDCHNALQLWREITAQGYVGTDRMVTAWAHQQRTEPAPTTPKIYRTVDTNPSTTSRLPMSRAVAFFLIRRPEQLSATQQQVLGQIQQASAEVAKGYALFHQFADLLRNKAADQLASWMQSARASGLAEMEAFATGLEADLPAIQSAASLSWSNAQTEGQVNRLKMLKRQMYGRANFDLLRRRVLYA